MAALAMAVLFRGLSRQELDCWTRAMINSGERLDFSVSPGRLSTNTPPAAWATRSRSRWFPWSPPAGRGATVQVADSGIRAGRWTSNGQSLGGGLH